MFNIWICHLAIVSNLERESQLSLIMQSMLSLPYIQVHTGSNYDLVDLKREKSENPKSGG